MSRTTRSLPTRNVPVAPQDRFVPTSGYDRTNLDLTTRPQDGFNQYAVGGYLKTHPVPSDKARDGLMDQVAERNEQDLKEILESASPQAAQGTEEQKYRDFYASGMDEAAIEAAGTTPLTEEFARIDGLQTPQDLQDEIAHLHASGIGAVFSLSGQQDPKNPSQVIATASQAGLGMANRSYYLDPDPKIRTAYTSHVEKMFQLLGDDGVAAAKSVLKIETALAEASLDDVALKDPQATYNMTDRKALAALTPHFDWDRYLSGIGTPNAQSVNVTTPQFFQKLDGILGNVSMQDWKTYLRWQVLNQAAPFLPKAFEQENFHFKSGVMKGVDTAPPRSKTVVQRTDDALGFAVGKKWVEKRFSPEANALATDMVNNIKDAAREKIKSGWMSEDTKRKALEKVDKMKAKVGYPDVWPSYDGLDIQKGPYLTNVLDVWKFEARRGLDSIGKPVDRDRWLMTPATVNAYYDPTMNEMALPAGILQPPFFDVNGDAASNYGATGGTIGHEFTHAFDDQGAQYDADGRLSNWWTPDDYAHFTQVGDAVVSQMDGYTFDGQHENGKHVEGEAIADLGGVELAYAAFLKDAKPSNAADGFTDKQRFWLNYALSWATSLTTEYGHYMLNNDEHPLPQHRVDAPLANMAAFYDAFNVKPGDAMYCDPKDRIKLWD